MAEGSSSNIVLDGSGDLSHSQSSEREGRRGKERCRHLISHKINNYLYSEESHSVGNQIRPPLDQSINPFSPSAKYTSFVVPYFGAFSNCFLIAIIVFFA
jgi:hypothetical protein